MFRLAHGLLAVCLAVLLAGCGGGHKGDGPDLAESAERAAVGRLSPSDLVYKGAFRLPGASGGSSWVYGGDALAYCPGGDPGGPADGYTGSLYGIGHDWQKYVSEVTIPTPRLPTGGLGTLRTATTLRPFRDVRSGVGSLSVLQEMVRVGMVYLPAQGAQTSGKLYLCWGAHLQEDTGDRVASHMWCERNLTGSRGAWYVGNYSPYSVNDYMFDIPKGWADRYVGGRRIATGRFRDGGWSGQGPSILAVAPWQHGNPPANNTHLSAVPLLLYSNTATDEPPYHVMNDYHHADAWTGGVWITSARGAAVVFAGTKGTGDCWYGLPDGTVWEPPYPPDPLNQRGWWSTGFIGQLRFYDPADLAQVARGRRPPYWPQPYATLNLDQYLAHVTQSQQKEHVAAICFDHPHGLLYLLEPFADGDKPLVHVWIVRR